MRATLLFLVGLLLGSGLASPTTAQQIGRMYASVTGTGAPIAVIASTAGAVHVYIK